METRETTEYKVYVLYLADMRGGVDKAKPVAVFDELQELKDFYNSQLADEPYKDTPSSDDYGNIRTWHKVFKEDSILEWYNPVNSDLEDKADTYDNMLCFGGVQSQWVDYYPSEGQFNVPFNPK